MKLQISRKRPHKDPFDSGCALICKNRRAPFTRCAFCMCKLIGLLKRNMREKAAGNWPLKAHLTSNTLVFDDMSGVVLYCRDSNIFATFLGPKQHSYLPVTSVVMASSLSLSVTFFQSLSHSLYSLPHCFSTLSFPLFQSLTLSLIPIFPHSLSLFLPLSLYLSLSPTLFLSLSPSPPVDMSVSSN